MGKFDRDHSEQEQIADAPGQQMLDEATDHESDAQRPQVVSVQSNMNDVSSAEHESSDDNICTTSDGSAQATIQQSKGNLDEKAEEFRKAYESATDTLFNMRMRAIPDRAACAAFALANDLPMTTEERQAVSRALQTLNVMSLHTRRIEDYYVRSSNNPTAVADSLKRACEEAFVPDKWIMGSYNSRRNEIMEHHRCGVMQHPSFYADTTGMASLVYNLQCAIALGIGLMR